VAPTLKVSLQIKPTLRSFDESMTSHGIEVTPRNLS